MIRNNHFHDNRARGILLGASNGLVENNRIVKPTADGLRVSTDINFWNEGYAGENITIRNNPIQGCNYAEWERTPTGKHMAALNVVAEVPEAITAAALHKNIVIEGNTIKDTPGLAILIASVDGAAVLGNTIIDANTKPHGETGAKIDAQAKGSIMVTRASNVRVEGTRQSATAEAYDAGVYVDERNTKNVTVKDNTVDPALAEAVKAKR